MKGPRWAAAALGGAILALGANVAFGQSLAGGCTVQAVTPLDSTIMLDASRSDPFLVDPEGSISWSATSPQAIKNHTWVINVEVGGLGIPVARGGDANADGTVVSAGTRSIPELIAAAEAQGVAGANLLAGMRGIYRVFGSIHGEGGTCSGDAYIKIVGNPLAETPGQVGAVVAAVGLAATLGAGVAKKEK
jgi:hypothetical protein